MPYRSNLGKAKSPIRSRAFQPAFADQPACRRHPLDGGPRLLLAGASARLHSLEPGQVREQGALPRGAVGQRAEIERDLAQSVVAVHGVQRGRCELSVQERGVDDSRPHGVNRRWLRRLTEELRHDVVREDRHRKHLPNRADEEATRLEHAVHLSQRRRQVGGGHQGEIGSHDVLRSGGNRALICDVEDHRRDVGQALGLRALPGHVHHRLSHVAADDLRARQSRGQRAPGLPRA
mmetsp:Transcript_50650/g.131679  ORF Transcript_50650/g.131679 Transcript_50650/m.131679 type:complete len:235 (+) Transcript_50650:253-957(+)